MEKGIKWNTNIRKEKDVHQSFIIVIEEEELIDLFEALEIFKEDDGLDIPKIDGLDQVIEILQNQDVANAIFECDVLRYQVVQLLHTYAEGFHIEYKTNMVEAYDIVNLHGVDKIDSTLEHTIDFVSNIPTLH